MAGKRVKKSDRSSFGLSLGIVAILAVIAGYFLGNYYIKMAVNPSHPSEERQVFKAPETVQEEKVRTPLSGTPAVSGSGETVKEEEDLLVTIEDEHFDTKGAQPVETIPTTSDGLIRVQVGSFNERPQALELAQKLQQDGYPTYITPTKPYRVQVGAFKEQSAAKSLVDKLIADGYSQVIMK
ncbi:MAG: SPOR domain-containing protein [Firmicutes bacterium]|nr:SPOR domain-containing protein [Bacillota bacterium]